ncbi:MAG: hypothetical protein H6741_02495 [Alphaproteobacteria bacterium]|nr:hypothetical protein [Alphaproteobacteria bacterium]MCB9791574.1 hypothetical protein [Alphaproteobacteria bacterium]
MRGPAYLLRPRLTGARNRWSRAEPKERLAYGVFGALGVLFWIGLFAGLTFGLGKFYEVEIFGPLITTKLMELLLLSLFAMLLFSNVVTGLSSFYLSEDLELLLSLPISKANFFYTRLAETLGQSSWAMLMFGVPVFIAYGVVCHASWVYYACLLVVVPAYLAMPAAFGAGLSTLLVTTFPARRVRELMAVMGILALVAIFILLRVMQPERLVNAQDFESVAAAVAQLQAPSPALFPPRWAAEVLDAAVRQRPMPWLQLGLLVSGAVGSVGVARWLTTRLYADGWARSQEARAARLARSKLLDAALGVLTRPLPPKMAAIVVKDVKFFIRDPSQWSQLFLLFSLIVIYLFSVNALPTDVVRGPYMQSFKNGLAFLNLGTAGFVMASIAARFQFAVVSGEGRAFWIMRSAPISAERYLVAKGIPGMLPMLVVGETLIVASNVLLSSPVALTLVGAFTALGLAFGISGIAMGMGATYPDFKVPNVARAAAGPAAMLFMVVALVLVVLVVALEILPVWFMLRADFQGSSLGDREAAIAAACFGAVAAVCLAATILPVRRAAKGLWERNL